MTPGLAAYFKIQGKDVPDFERLMLGRPQIESARMPMPFIAAIITEAAEVDLAS